MTYIDEHRNSLLSIYGQIWAGRSLELPLNSSLKEEDLDKECCLSAVLVHKYNNGEVDFPIKKSSRIRVLDKLLADDLYTIIVCEQAVRDGILVRDGNRYCPNGDRIVEKKKYGKFLTKSD